MPSSTSASRSSSDPRPARGGGSSSARAACGSSCRRASSRARPVSRELRKPTRTPASTTGSRARGDALVVPAERAEPAGRGRVGGDVHELRAVAQRAEIGRAHEARPGVGGLGPVDPVELGRVADRLVHLELHLLGVEDDGGDAGRAGVGRQERQPPRPRPAAPRGRGRATRRTPSRPARSSRRGSRDSCASARGRRPTASASMPPPHSTISCRSRAPSVEAKARCSRRARTAASVISMPGRASSSSARQADADLLLEGHLDRIARRTAARYSPSSAGAGASSTRCARVTMHSRARRRPPGRRPPERPSAESRGSQAKPQAPSTRTRTPMPSLSESETDSTARFFVETFCERRCTPRASA